MGFCCQAVSGVRPVAAHYRNQRGASQPISAEGGISELQFISITTRWRKTPQSEAAGPLVLRAPMRPPDGVSVLQTPAEWCSLLLPPHPSLLRACGAHPPSSSCKEFSSDCQCPNRSCSAVGGGADWGENKRSITAMGPEVGRFSWLSSERWWSSSAPLGPPSPGRRGEWESPYRSSLDSSWGGNRMLGCFAQFSVLPLIDAACSVNMQPNTETVCVVWLLKWLILEQNNTINHLNIHILSKNIYLLKQFLH